MNNPESIIEKLKAIVKLVNDPASTPGEQDNGRRMLERLMKKHNITKEDLLNKEKYYYPFVFYTKWEKRLLIQVMYKVVGNKKDVLGYSVGRRYYLLVSTIEAKDIQWLYDIYRKSFNKQLDEFYEAFVQANHIFASGDSTNREYTEEEMERLIRIMQMAKGITPDVVIPASRHLESANL